jgi:hypothetical protein
VNEGLETPAASRRVGEVGPTRGLSLPPAILAVDRAPSRRHTPPDEPDDEDVLLRLALWLADVAADAAAVASQARREADDPPVGEPAP